MPRYVAYIYGHLSFFLCLAATSSNNPVYVLRIIDVSHKGSSLRWRSGVAVTATGAHQRSYSTSGPVSTGMGDRL